MKTLSCACLLIAVTACSSGRQPLPVYGQVPPFELTAQTGQPFDAKSLEGKIWVADFIYTTCTGPCPRMTSMMSQVQSSVTTLPAIKLISFTVDPENDTPSALNEYAKRQHAEPDRWFFLTGPRDTLHHLKRDAFKLGDVDGSMNHSTRMALVDGKGRIRGYYGTSEDSPVSQLLADIRRVMQERS